MISALKKRIPNYYRLPKEEREYLLKVEINRERKKARRLYTI